MAGFITIKGKLVGAETVAADLRRLGDTLRAKLKAEVQAQGHELAVAAQGLAPVLQRPHKGRTPGQLRGSIRSVGRESPTGLLADVGTDVYYGKWQESGYTPNPRKKSGWQRNPRKASDWKKYTAQRGGRRIVAHPFLKPALASLRGRFRERLDAAVKGTAL